MSCVQATTPTHLLCHTITVQRVSVAVTAAGSTQKTYTNHLVGIPARVQPRGGTELEHNGRDQARATVVIYVAGTMDVIASDRVLHGGKVYDVENVNDFQYAQVLKRLDCEEPKP